MANGAAAFMAGLLGGGLKGYAMNKEWERQEAKDALDKQERELRIDAAKRKAADDRELRDVLRGAGSGSTPPGASANSEGGATAQPVSMAGPVEVAPLGPGQDAPASGNAPAVPPTIAERAQVRALFDGQGRASLAGTTAGTGTISPPATAQAEAGGTIAAVMRGMKPQDGTHPVMAAMQQRAADGQLDRYLTETGPKVIQTLLQQGQTGKAEAFAKFIDSQAGRAYAGAWVQGVRQLSLGNVTGALGSFEKLYNENLPDGNRIKLSPIEGDDGRFTVEQYDARGKLLGSRKGSGEQIASAAALYLSPAEAVKHFAGEQAKRSAAAEITDRQEYLEALRQQGRAYADDRAAQRTQMQIDAADRRTSRQIDAADQRQSRQLEARERGGNLTPAQVRGNLEIDSARDYVAGMNPEEIRRRTTPTTATGRENPSFDPMLARMAKLASRRKIGEDSDFDGADGGQSQSAAAWRRPPAPAIDRKELAQRFRADRDMNNFKLGRETERGIEVLDSSGKLRGYYR